MQGMLEFRLINESFLNMKLRIKILKIFFDKICYKMCELIIGQVLENNYKSQQQNGNFRLRIL